MTMSGKDFLKSHVLSWRRKVYSDWEDATSSGMAGLWARNRESTATGGLSLDRWHQKTIGACRTKRPSAGKTAYWHERSKVRGCTSMKNSECHCSRAILYWQIELSLLLGRRLGTHFKLNRAFKVIQGHWCQMDGRTDGHTDGRIYYG